MYNNNNAKYQCVMHGNDNLCEDKSCGTTASQVRKATPEINLDQKTTGTNNLDQPESTQSYIYIMYRDFYKPTTANNSNDIIISKQYNVINQYVTSSSNCNSGYRIHNPLTCNDQCSSYHTSLYCLLYIQKTVILIYIFQATPLGAPQKWVAIPGRRWQQCAKLHSIFNQYLSLHIIAKKNSHMKGYFRRLTDV